eukprot:CAMPEP_0169292948 /NCGR_PEP_ID=MMETSP1016-20121227/63019_1 /TAXON_ID=342587 /ORGANISM="Karlodinium micrum, Strain CCMP2283" /LENGTH=164 /DNA_ID=CAMNT_0009383587 /DNA_START=194 /DNA_END=685 /DNA_ORIENTATION=-
MPVVEQVQNHIAAIEDSAALNAIVANILDIAPEAKLKEFAESALKGMTDEERTKYLKGLSQPGGPLQGLEQMLVAMKKEAILKLAVPLLQQMDPAELKEMFKKGSTVLPTKKRQEWGRDIVAMLDPADLQALVDKCVRYLHVIRVPHSNSLLKLPFWHYEKTNE